MTTYGYVRKNFPEPTLVQVKSLIAKSCENMYIEEPDLTKHSELQKLLSVIKEGDRMIVYSIDVFGQTLRPFSKMITYLYGNKVEFISVTDEIDTEKNQEFYNTVLLVNAMDATLNKCKTKNKIGEIRSNGADWGRPSIKESTINEIEELYQKNKYSLRKIAEICDVSLGTVHKYIQRYKNSVVN